MSTTTLPFLREFSSSRAVGSDANNVRKSIEKSRQVFLGNSIASENLYKDQLLARFLDLKAQWKRDTCFSSNPDSIVQNQKYIQIINLGKDIIPIIFEDWEVTDNLWFVALMYLTNNNPVAPEHIGYIREMKNDWREWAHRENIL
jgi:hypothetical protein